MLIKQLAPGASVAVQVVEAMAKLVAFAPVMLKEKFNERSRTELVTGYVPTGLLTVAVVVQIGCVVNPAGLAGLKMGVSVGRGPASSDLGR
jgi:ABC-type long-subunit fatty acid transport system fused permease/ATPase subunit